MRNTQLIRQWSLLIALAEGRVETPLTLTGIATLSKMFDKCEKTIRRDLNGLAQAGFLLHTVLPPVRDTRYLPGHKPYISPLRSYAARDGLAALLQKIQARTDDTLIAATQDFMRCNKCLVPFTLRRSGKLDLPAMREHKQACAA